MGHACRSAPLIRVAPPHDFCVQLHGPAEISALATYENGSNELSPGPDPVLRILTGESSGGKSSPGESDAAVCTVSG